VGLTPTTGENGPPWLIFTGQGKTDSWAAFWNVKYNLTERFALRAGGRFTHENRTIDNTGFLRLGPNGTGPQTILTNVAADDERTFDEYTNEAGAEFKITDEVMVYYTFAQGFKSGAGLLGQIDAPITDPTFVDSHEVGIKSRWFDRRLTLNLAAFDSVVDGLQAEGSSTDPVRGLLTRFTNVTRLDVHGAEADITLSVTDQLRLGAAVAWTVAKFADFTSIDPLDPRTVTAPTTALQQVAGNRAPRTPEWKGNLNAEYGIALRNGGLITIGTDVTYTGKIFYDEFNHDPVSEDPYTLVALRVGYAPAEQRWSLDFWGQNLTDEFAINTIGITTIPRVVRKQVIPPRTWGASWSYRF
jgi:iron complex outermembrane receptor protein